MKLFFVIVFALPFLLLAQKNTGSQFIYTGLNYSPNSGDQLSPVIGFYHVDKKNNLNDFRLNQINYRKTFGTNTSSLNFSYHKIIGLNKKSDSKFYFGLGLGTSIYYARTIRKPLTSTTFLSANTKVGALLSIQPVVNYSFSKKFFLGFSVNTELSDQYISFSRYDNPALPIAQQKQTQVLMEIFDFSNLNFSVTLGFKIN